MSIHVISWMLKHSNATGSDRLALLVFADKADEDGADAFPSLDRIALEGRMSRPTAVAARRRLVEQGRLERDGDDPHGRGVPNFKVRMDVAAEGAPPKLPERDRGKKADPDAGGKEADPRGKDEDPQGVKQDYPNRPEPSEPSADAEGYAPVEEIPSAFDPYLASLKRVAGFKRARGLAGRKQGEVDAAAALKACRDFSDRDLPGELERFEAYWTGGGGVNRTLSHVAQAWRNWLRQSPPASRLQGRSARARADRDMDRLESLKASATVDSTAKEIA